MTYYIKYLYYHLSSQHNKVKRCLLLHLKQSSESGIEAVISAAGIPAELSQIGKGVTRKVDSF